MQLRRIFGMARPWRGTLAVCGLLMVAETAVVLVVPWLAGRFADRLLAGLAGAGAWLPLALIGLFALQALFRMASAFLLSRTAERVLADLRTRLYDHLQALPLAWHQQRRKGEVLSLPTHDVSQLSGFITGSLLGALKPGDIPADVRTRAIGKLIEKYFAPGTVVQAGYPLDMRYAGPREALLHAVFRQNYGCAYQIIGRDHAGVGSYYGPFDAHHIFDEIPKGSLEIQPLKIDWTFWCYACGGMASARTCPHGESDRLLVSGTKLRKWLSEGADVPVEFSRPEVLDILREYYASIDEKDKVEVKLTGHSAR